jgi:DNA polymerase-3 subunit gamma/tau
VIDEVHQLTGHAFNAMLKTLEEPPEHVKFILATTDPQKIPITVLSRCLQFNLKQMPQQHIIDHLSRILEAEKVAFEPLALRHLAKAAAGSMRDALSLLDQAIAHGAGAIEEEKVRDMLGTVGDDYLYALLDAIAARDVTALIAVADQMETRSLNFDSALQEIAVLFHRIALLQFAPEAIGDSSERERLKPYAAAFDAEFLQLCYQIAIHGRDDLALAPDEYAGFTMALLRLVAFNPETVTARPTNVALSASPVPSAPARPVSVAPSVASSPSSAPLVSQPAPARKVSSSVPVVSDDWHAVVAALAITGMARQLAQHCELAEIGDTQITLRLPPAHKHLQGKVPQDKLQAELQTYYGKPLRLNIEVAAAAAETPAERAKNVQRERQDLAIAAIEGDSFVREVVEMFDATIDESTIKPI